LVFYDLIISLQTPIVNYSCEIDCESAGGDLQVAGCAKTRKGYGKGKRMLLSSEKRSASPWVNFITNFPWTFRAVYQRHKKLILY